ncbi:MAG: hypothetical protein R3C19_07885 [Planctomycetaceae bacterium]
MDDIAVKMELPFGTMELSPRMTARRPGIGSTNLAIIDFTPSVTLQPSKEDAPVAVSLESSTGAGRVKFDINTGQRRQHVDENVERMTLSSEAQGQKFPGRPSNSRRQ